MPTPAPYTVRTMTDAEHDAYWRTLGKPELIEARRVVQLAYDASCKAGRTAAAYASRFPSHRATDAASDHADDAHDRYRAAFDRYHGELRPAALAAAGLAHLAAAKPATLHRPLP